MIDLHAHVLPGLDDGPETLEESLQLLRTMQEQGVHTIVAAAHALDGRYNATREGVLRGLELVRAAAHTAGLTVKILPSMELYLGYDLLRAVKTGQVLGLNQSRYLVVELPHREYPIYTDRALFELMIAGYRPILNHPERNTAILRNPDLMYELAEKGVLAMVTAASLTGRFGREVQAAARAFVEEGAATLVVSDAHDLRGRKPDLAEGLAVARGLGKADQAAEAALIR